jgi:hypothetical protein
MRMSSTFFLDDYMHVYELFTLFPARSILLH